MRDLEIRGAGNLLGSEQHGHMTAVGYELYCRMVDEAVRACAGGAADTDSTDGAAERVAEPKLDIAIDAFIPESYITDEADRLEIYHRISRISDAGGADEISNEIEDRYGQVPSQVGALIRISLVRALAGAAGVKAVSAGSAAELDEIIETLKLDVIE
jgi:transcription-repair coupling factor (superfamily II helicase)